MELSLRDALRVSNSPCIAFTGAGGKTTAMFQLARQLSSPVIITAMTHLGAWQIKLADNHIVMTSSAQIKDLKEDKSITLITGVLDGDRTKPVSADLSDEIRLFCKNHSIPLLIEADGSRQKPLKAWAEHEPPIPGFVNEVVHIVGLSCLGKSLNEENIHRPEIFSKLSGLRIEEQITQNALIKVVTHTEGGLKNIPTNAKKTIVLNQADTPELQSIAHGMSHSLLSSFHSVIVASLKQEKVFAVHEPVAGIILAAGESSRFGQPKQLLDWKGESFIRAVVKTASNAGLSQVIVVTGANAENVESAISGFNVITIVRNNEWKKGQGNSIRAGITAITAQPTGKECGAAIFLLADQPQVTTSIIRALVEKHANGLYSILAPMVIDRRANPVLFDSSTFSDLLTLEGDVGGRAIFHKHRVEYLPWHDDSLLLDVDTPEHYQRLISNKDL